MMAAEEGDTEKNTRPCRAGERAPASHGAQKKKENQGSPNGAVQHLRPGIGSHESAEAEGQAGEQGSGVTPLQVAAKPVAEQRPLNVNEHEIPMQIGLPDPSVPQRSEKQQPVDRVGGAGLGLRQERLAAPEVGIPNRHSAVMPLACLKLIPGQNLVRIVRQVEPGVLIGEDQFPKEADANHYQEGGESSRTEPAACLISIGVVLYSHLHPSS